MPPDDPVPELLQQLEDTEQRTKAAFQQHALLVAERDDLIRRLADTDVDPRELARALNISPEEPDHLLIRVAIAFNISPRRAKRLPLFKRPDRKR